MLVGRRGRQRESAVAAEHRGDTVLQRRARRRVPEQLRVVVGVQVDEAGCERLPFRINGFRGQVIHIADRDDQSVLHPDIAAPGGSAGAVDDLGIANQKIEHGGLLHVRQPPTVRQRVAEQLAALRWVILAASSADRFATLRATTSCVSGHVESACG